MCCFIFPARGRWARSSYHTPSTANRRLRSRFVDNFSSHTHANKLFGSTNLELSTTHTNHRKAEETEAEKGKTPPQSQGTLRRDAQNTFTTNNTTDGTLKRQHHSTSPNLSANSQKQLEQHKLFTEVRFEGARGYQPLFV